MVLDGHWNVVLANDSCRRLFGDGLVGTNFVRDALTNPAAADRIVNWPEVAWAGLDRLRMHRDRRPFDIHLQDLVFAAEEALSAVDRPTASSEVMVCPWFRVGEQIVRTMSMVARFDPAVDITLEEVRVS